MAEEIITRKKAKDELTNLIENLFSQWQDATDPDKPFFESQVRKYALQYKEVTGEWYFRK